jgi:hypothetical protein
MMIGTHFDRVKQIGTTSLTCSGLIYCSRKAAREEEYESISRYVSFPSQASIPMVNGCLSAQKEIRSGAATVDGHHASESVAKFHFQIQALS